MAFVQKINFTANNTNLLQQNNSSRRCVDYNKTEPMPPRHPRKLRPPSTLSYISTIGTVASFIVAVIALKQGRAAKK